MNLYVGASGYAYKEWKGSFYPKDLPAKSMLAYYAQRFRSVEINASFYKMPTTATLESWAAQVPADFRFVIKAPQKITHIRRLKGAEQETAEMFKAAQALGRRLGPFLFQLPPNMKKDAPRLAGFLAALPRRGRVAFEFRHPSWFDDEVFTLLRRRKAALCVADTDEGVAVPFVATTDWGYLRLRRLAYAAPAMKGWVRRVGAQAWKDAYVFFKHEDEGNAPRFAARFLALAPKRE